MICVDFCFDFLFCVEVKLFLSLQFLVFLGNVKLSIFTIVVSRARSVDSKPFYRSPTTNLAALLKCVSEG